YEALWDPSDPFMSNSLNNGSFERILIDALSASEKSDDNEESRFSASKFFNNWFREKGSAYFFLFRKNLKVTNIQFAELIALLKTYNVCSDTEKTVHELQFVTEDEFKDAVRQLVQ